MNLNHFVCGSVMLKCQFMPVINLQKPCGTRVRRTDWFIHNVIYGWLSKVISQMNTFLLFSHIVWNITYRINKWQRLPEETKCAQVRLTNFTLLLSFKSVFFSLSPVLLACHCADRQYPLMSSGLCHWWRGVVTCHSDMWEQRACPPDRPAGWAGLQLFSFVNTGRILITAVIFV